MTFTLPQLSFSFKKNQFQHCEIVLVLGGRPPSPSWLCEVAKDKEVWAVDSGAEICMRAGVMPSRAIGDFDSISARAQAWLKSFSVPFEKYSADKDLTDFQLALQLASDYKVALVTGCWGGRFDHAFSNIFSLFWSARQGTSVCAFADDTEVLVPLEGAASLEIRFLSRPCAVSLLPLTPLCEGVSIKGTKWELQEVSLSQGYPYAISNEALRDRINVCLSSGFLGLYCAYSSH